MVPAALAMLTAPLPPSGVTASAAAGMPAATFSAGDDGFAEPAAQAVTVVADVAQLEAMLRATAAMPESGSRPTPCTGRVTRPPGPTGRLPSTRVSKSRTGSTGTKLVRPGSAAAAPTVGAVRAAWTVTWPTQVRAAAVASALARVTV